MTHLNKTSINDKVKDSNKMEQVDALNALLIAPAGQQWLQSRSRGRVLHLFDRACNLINDAGEVVSLVTAVLGPGPFAIVVDNVHFPVWLTAASPVTLTQTGLQVGPLHIHTQTAVSWQPRPPWHTCRHLAQLKHLIVTHPHFDPAVTVPAAALMRQALHQQEIALYQQAAYYLAGRGPGLTPAGDDFLMGVLYALWVMRPPQFEQFIDIIRQTAVPRTTSLSGAWLQAAARGEAALPWHKLVTASDETAHRAAIDHILATGHTSGADALAGFVMTLTQLAAHTSS